MSLNLASIILEALAKKTDIVLQYENTSLDPYGKLQVKQFPRNANDPVMSGPTLLPGVDKLEVPTPTGSVLKSCSLRIQPHGTDQVSFIGSVRDPEMHTISGQSTLQALRDRVAMQTDAYDFLQHLLNFADGAQLPTPGGQALSSF